MRRGWIVLLALALAGCVTGPPITVKGDPAAAIPEKPDPARQARVRLELASLYFSRGQASTALDEVNGALKANPELAEGYNLRGLIYADLGEIRAAERSFQRALALAPTDGSVNHNYGWFLCQQHRYADADRQFAAALAQPRYGGVERTQLAQGVCEARSGRWAEAEHTLLQAYQLDPRNPVTAFNLADVLLHERQYERARFYVGRINAVESQITAQSLWLAARIEHAAGNAQGTQVYGRMLTDRYPQSTEALNFARGKFDE
ncbi:MAG: type IV pilus biogenesis/stability protein PilW [Burkholderiales bacterium]|nr:type IV pilus biogenesis/stability protein PilW [Burkholderiales bacterium]MDE2161357.1 type IV pilus biogenesis/stability protein PilW [Burkholderiales bacterium]MDE2503993.1 type IV pilus biogenesis/stability protein PilW [Burkholderiales bacterium]